MKPTCEQVGDHLDDVARQQLPAARGPVQHRAAGEVPAAAHERQTIAELEHVALPVADRGVGAHHPLGVRGVQVDRAVEAMRPLDHARVVVRVRDRDRGEPAAPLDLRRGRLVEQRDAVPQQVGVAVGDEQRALADRECGIGADAGQRALVAELVGVAGGQLGQRRPALPGLRDVLARIEADRARRRRGLRVRVLGPAGNADEPLHGAQHYASRCPSPHASSSSPTGPRRRPR